MSTMGLDSWAVDLKDVGTVYPFAGSEVLMVILCLIFWLGFHVYQIKAENDQWDDSSHDADNASAGKSIDRY